jgi:hypothetical protein
MAKETFKAGSTYRGPLAIFDDEQVDGVRGFYALTKDGKELLKHRGKPVRLTQIDLAPGDPDNGDERYVIAEKDGPMQLNARPNDGVIELEPENVRGKTDVSPGG